MTKIVGLTGGIGSGKTTIAKHINSLGIPVYIADDAAKKILLLPEILNALKLVFGETVFEDGLLNKDKLSKIVFNNPEMLKQLNQIVHPAVKIDFDNWLTLNKNQPLVVKEAAILFESGGYKDCDVIITIVAPINERIQRVMARENTNSEAVLSRMNNQWTDEMRIEKSDYVIENKELIKACAQTEKILKNILNQ
jgi:dephospho-CoA kinase